MDEMKRLGYVLAAIACLSGGGLSACKGDPEEPDTDQTTGEEVEEAADEAGDDIEEAADDVEDEVDEEL
jgi:hypothetical protein